MVGDAFLAEETAAVGRDEHVVFDADATEVLVFLDFVEVEEFSIRAVRAPEVNEVGDEIGVGRAFRKRQYPAAKYRLQTP